MEWKGFFQSRAIVRLEQFHQIMELAKQIAGSNPKALLDLIKVLLRPLQASLMVRVIERPQTATNDVQQWNFFMGAKYAAFFSDKESQSLRADKLKVRLASDVILPWPWDRERTVLALANIGTGKTLGPWREDANHFVTLWLPWEIAFVHGGNHSITAGIIEGEGEITPRYVYDMSSVLDCVECDGRFYRWRENGKRITKVGEARIAAVFEIGRLIGEKRKIKERENEN
jgi:hypothetical protein